MATSSRPSPDGRPVPLKDTRTQLFVGNLPYRVRWQDLKDLFRKAGTVLRADVSLGPDNRSRGYGTVLLATAEDAGRAVDMFNGYSWQTRVLEVRLDRVGLPPDLDPTASTSGYGTPRVPFAGPSIAGSLPFHCQWQDLKDLFRQAGTILRADVALGQDGRSRGFGTVVFAGEGDAERAVRMFNGYEYNGRPLKVHYDKYPPSALSAAPYAPAPSMSRAGTAPTSPVPSHAFAGVNLNQQSQSLAGTSNNMALLGNLGYPYPRSGRTAEQDQPYRYGFEQDFGYAEDYGYGYNVDVGVEAALSTVRRERERELDNMSQARSPFEHDQGPFAHPSRLSQITSNFSASMPVGGSVGPSANELPTPPSSAEGDSRTASAAASSSAPTHPPLGHSLSQPPLSIATAIAGGSKRPATQARASAPVLSLRQEGNAQRTSPPQPEASRQQRPEQSSSSHRGAHNRSGSHGQQSSRPAPGPIALPPPSAFPIPPPHTLSPISPMHHPHAYAVQMPMSPMLPSPLHHPMIPSPLHHPMQMQYQAGLAMTPHGLPPITPSMPSFSFAPHAGAPPSAHPLAHSHIPPQYLAQMTPGPGGYPAFSPGVTMSPGVFWNGGGGRDPRINAAVGAPVH
ncbi:hypothetical protein DENSPDRAFT_801049, partial [Dentipellis sp. KUC8613]